jgi:hypothetical protein
MRVTLLILSMMVVLGHGSYLPNLNFSMPHLNFSLPQFNLPSIFGNGKVEDRNDGSASLQGIWNNNIEVSLEPRTVASSALVVRRSNHSARSHPLSFLVTVALVSLSKRAPLEMSIVITASFQMVAS